MLHILNVWELWHTSDIQFCEMLLNHNKFIPPALNYYTKCQYNYPNTQDLLFFHSRISQYTLIRLTLAVTWLMTWRKVRAKVAPRHKHRERTKMKLKGMICLVIQTLLLDWYTITCAQIGCQRCPNTHGVIDCTRVSDKPNCVSIFLSAQLVREVRVVECTVNVDLVGSRNPSQFPVVRKQSWTYLPRCIQ